MASDRPRPAADAVPLRPNPGSDEALAQGCECPVLDNCHGRRAPYQPDGWWIAAGCPVHDPHPPAAPAPRAAGE